MIYLSFICVSFLRGLGVAPGTSDMVGKCSITKLRLKNVPG